MDKGAKTTECWAVISVGLMILADGSDYFTIPKELIMTYATLALGYVGSRTVKKTAEVKASADISALAARVKRDLS